MHLLQMSSSILIIVIGVIHPMLQVIEGAPVDAAFQEEPVSVAAALQDELVEESVAPETLPAAKKRKPIPQLFEGKRKRRKGHD